MVDKLRTFIDFDCLVNCHFILNFVEDDDCSAVVQEKLSPFFFDLFVHFLVSFFQVLELLQSSSSLLQHILLHELNFKVKVNQFLRFYFKFGDFMNKEKLTNLCLWTNFHDFLCDVIDVVKKWDIFDHQRVLSVYFVLLDHFFGIDVV